MRDDAVQAACPRGPTQPASATAPASGRRRLGVLPGFAKTLALGLLPIPAAAATVVTTLSVTAVVLPSPSTCLIGPAGTVPEMHKGAPSPAMPAISVRCTGARPYEVSLDAEGPAGTVVATSRITGRLAAAWSYAPAQDHVQLISWSGAARRDRGIGPGRSAEAAFAADVDTITATVRY